MFSQFFLWGVKVCVFHCLHLFIRACYQTPHSLFHVGSPWPPKLVFLLRSPSLLPLLLLSLKEPTFSTAAFPEWQKSREHMHRLTENICCKFDGLHMNSKQILL